MNKDITRDVDFEMPDDESLPLTRCACGQTFPAWTFILGVYDDQPTECPNCHRKMYFAVWVKVLEVVDDGQD